MWVCVCVWLCVCVRVCVCVCSERKRAVAISHEAVSFFCVVVMSLANCCDSKQLSLLPLADRVHTDTQTQPTHMTYARTNTFIYFYITDHSVSVPVHFSSSHNTYLILFQILMDKVFSYILAFFCFLFFVFLTITRNTQPHMCSTDLATYNGGMWARFLLCNAF